MTDVAERGTGPRGPGAIVRIVNLYYIRLLQTKLISDGHKLNEKVNFWFN